MKRIFKIFDRLLRLPPVAVLMVIVATVIGFGVGFHMAVIDPQSYRHDPAFRVAVDLAAPQVIGGAFMVSAVCLGFFAYKKDPDVAAFVLAVLWFSLTVLTSPSTTGGGTASSAWAYLASGFACLLILRAYREGASHVVDTKTEPGRSTETIGTAGE